MSKVDNASNNPETTPTDSDDAKPNLDACKPDSDASPHDLDTDQQTLHALGLSTASDTLGALHLSALKLSAENLANLADSNFELPSGQKFEPFVGIDIEDIDRWRKLLPEIDAALGKRIFFPEEHEYCRKYADKAPRYAGRWCAKEAVFKALSSRYKLLATDIKILCDSEERPYVDLSHERFAGANPIIRLSISHSDTTALAFALALVPAP